MLTGRRKEGRVGGMSITVAVYDTKSYDRSYLSAAAQAQGADVTWVHHEFRLSNETVGSLAGADAACVFVNDRLDARCLEAVAAHGVKHVALRCAGYNNVDLVAAARLGVRLTRVPAYSPHAVAEHTVALLMTLNRKIHRAYNRVREQNFSLGGLVGFDLHGKTVGVVGTGKIGRLAARIFRGFGTRVLAHDAYPDEIWAAEEGVAYAGLDELLATSDIVSLHLPLFPETHHLLNAERLARMKPGAYVVNTSRGKLIDTEALIEALRRGRLGGVALDVYEEEEGVFFEDLSEVVLQDEELLLLMSFPNVLITAHQAFLTKEALGEISRVTVANLTRLAARQAPLEATEVLTG